jgi:low affinity Fe/Cu permease
MDLRPGPAEPPLRPSDLPEDLPPFDRFAERSAVVSGRAPFFAACVLLIVAWIPTVIWLSTDTWQLTIQTVTAIITFVLVALLQNSSSRRDAATQHKLNEICDALANLISALDVSSPELQRDVKELKAAVGLEERERS